MIDFVVPCHPKDFPSLKICVSSIKENISIVNRIFVICNNNPNIDGVIHIPEQNYAAFIDREKIEEKFRQYCPNLLYRTKWIYQQFIKLFSARVIHELTDSYVIVDSDTVFLKNISFFQQTVQKIRTMRNVRKVRPLSCSIWEHTHSIL